jgi:hypothetical protein
MPRQVRTLCCDEPISSTIGPSPDDLRTNDKCCGEPSNAHYHKCPSCGLGGCSKIMPEIKSKKTGAV